jgi:hypothetical protein
MATTLSYGYINPQNGDPGSTWFPALNSNITQLNGHNHDGINSAPLTATGIAGAAVSIPAASWVLDVAGRYKQDVTVPAGYNMTQYSITFYLSTGEIILPSITQLSGTTFRIFGIDNTVTYSAVFR